MEQEFPDLSYADQLRRFCYLGSLQPVFIQNHCAVSMEWFDWIQYIVFNIDDQLFIRTLTELLGKRGNLPRIDEVIFAYATYLRVQTNVEWKVSVRDAADKILRTEKHFILFCYYSNKIRGDLGFFRSALRIIKNWYAKQRPKTLIQMWKGQMSLHNMNHRKILRICHISDEILGDNLVAKAYIKGYKSLMSDPDAKRHPILYNVCKLRTMQNLGKVEIGRLVNTLDLTWEQVPVKYLRYSCVAEFLLYNMGVKDLINAWYLLKKFKHLENGRLLRLIKYMSTEDAIKRANIHPSVMLCKMNTLGIPLTPSGCKKIGQKKIRAFQITYFQKMFRDTFQLNKPTGMRIMITLTVQKNYLKKPITKKGHISYFEAVVAFAFAYYKKEPNTRVYTFNADRDGLSDIKWTEGFNFEDALEAAKLCSCKKSFQRLVQPIETALKEEDAVYDLFIVVVPTAGRSNRGNRSTDLASKLREYQQKKNLNARYVIVNVLKRKRSMQYMNLKDENILEICGINMYTAKLIETFAQGKFD